MSRKLDRAKLAFFIPSLGGGGAERVMLTLADAFAGKGYVVDLVVVRVHGERVGDVPPSVRLVNLAASRVITCIPALVRYLHRNQPAAMLTALPGAGCVAVWARAIARVRTRLVLAQHSTLSMSTAGATTRRGRIMPLFMRWAYPRADGIVAVSQGVAADLARMLHLPRPRINVIYNPVVTEDLIAKSYQAADHPWLQPGEPPVVLGVGRLVPVKDFALLIHAFARLGEKATARLMILGEGPERRRLQRLIDELGITCDVAMPGFVANPYAYMRAAKVFVLSSRWEGLSNVLIEALACGAAVVSTDCPSGPAEILAGGQWGQLVPVGNVARLCDAIQTELAAPRGETLARAMCFDVPTAVARYAEMLLPHV